MYADPSGQCFMLLTGLIGAVVGAVAGGIIAACNGGDIAQGALIGAAAGGLIGLTCGAAAGVVAAGTAFAATSTVMGTSTMLAASGATVMTAAEVAAASAASAPQIIDTVSKVFTQGQAFETSFVSTAGITVDAYADVAISGSTLTLNNICIYSRIGDIANQFGKGNMMAFLDNVRALARSEGFTELIVNGYHVANSTSVNAGKLSICLFIYELIL